MSEANTTTDESGNDTKTTTFAAEAFITEESGDDVEIRAFMPRSAVNADDESIREKVGMDDDALAELHDSMARSQETPITVRPDDDGEPEVVSGYRRVYAAALATINALDTDHAPVSLRAEVRDMTDTEAARARFAGNHFNEEPSKIEQARLLWIIKRENGWSQREVAEFVGKTQPWVSNTLGLLELPERAREMVDAGEIDPVSAVRITRELPGPEDGESADESGDSADESAESGTVEPSPPEMSEEQEEMLERARSLTRDEIQDELQERSRNAERITELEEMLSTVERKHDLIGDYQNTRERVQTLRERADELSAELDELWAEAPDRIDDADAREAVEKLREHRDEIDAATTRVEQLEAVISKAESVRSALQDKADEIDPRHKDRYQRLKDDFTDLKSEVGDAKYRWLNAGSLVVQIDGLDRDSLAVDDPDDPDDPRVDADSVPYPKLAELLEVVNDLTDVRDDLEPLEEDAQRSEKLKQAATNAANDLSELQKVEDAWDMNGFADDHGEQAAERFRNAVEQGASLSDLRRELESQRDRLEELEAEAEDVEAAREQMEELAPEIRETSAELEAVRDELADIDPTSDECDRTQSYADSIRSAEGAIRNRMKEACETFAQLDAATQADLLDEWEGEYDVDLSPLETVYETGEVPDFSADESGEDAAEDADESDDTDDTPDEDDITVTHKGGGWYAVTHGDTDTILTPADTGEDAAEALAATWADDGLDAARELAKDE